VKQRLKILLPRLLLQLKDQNIGCKRGHTEIKMKRNVKKPCWRCKVLEALISERELDGAALWRVRVGPFVGQSEVTQTRARLQSAGIPSTIIRINKSN